MKESQLQVKLLQLQLEPIAAISAMAVLLFQVEPVILHTVFLLSQLLLCLSWCLKRRQPTVPSIWSAVDLGSFQDLPGNCVPPAVVHSGRMFVLVLSGSSALQ